MSIDSEHPICVKQCDKQDEKVEYYETVKVPGTEMEVCRGTVTGVLKTIGDMDRKPWSA